MARIRSLTARLGDAFEASPLPAYILNDQRRVQFCNPAFLDWTRLTLEQVIGARCDYHSNPEPTLTGLCPPPDSLTGLPGHCLVAMPGAGGDLSRRRAWVVPLGGTDASTVLVLVESTDLPPNSDTNVGCEARDLHDRLRSMRVSMGSRFHPEQLLGESLAAKRIREMVRVSAAGRARTLIVGPVGSGREHVARTIHYAVPNGSTPSSDSPAPLLALACPVLDREMLQSTIRTFVKRGGDAAGTRGSASLLLTDADQLNGDAQTELAGYLNLPGFDLRLLATARRNLLELARESRFRHDLANALTTMVIELPPLRERQRDLPILAQHFLEEFNQSGGKQLSGFTSEALDRLASYSWPGNMDELVATVDEACRRAEHLWIQLSDLPARVQIATSLQARSRKPEENLRLDDFLVEIEKELMQRALQKTKGNKAKAARLLGIHRARLIRRVNQLGLGDASQITAVPFEPIEIPLDKPPDQEGA